MIRRVAVDAGKSETKVAIRMIIPTITVELIYLEPFRACNNVNLNILCQFFMRPPAFSLE